MLGGSGGGGVIDEPPEIKEIENPSNGTNITHKSSPGVSEANLPGRIFPELLDDGVPEIHVNIRAFGRRATIEELWKETDLA